MNFRVRNVRTPSNARVKIVRLFDSFHQIEKATVYSLKNDLRNFNLALFFTLLYLENAEVIFIGSKPFQKRQIYIEDILCQSLSTSDLV